MFSRQVRKTTLARPAFRVHACIDLENPRTLERLRVDARFDRDAAGASDARLAARSPA
jgi:hypothetical protein